MKLFTSDDIRAIERNTITSENLTTATLVERVADAAANEIATRWRASKRTVVFAGPGNNGSDALATAARLCDHGFSPVVYLFNIGGNALKAECRVQRDKFRAHCPHAEFHEITNTFNVPELSATDLVIDGLFGSGLREPLAGGFMSLVRYINESGATVVSLDVPSGMFSEWNHLTTSRNIIHATLTLAVQFPKISFFFPSSAELTGQWKTLDIGLSREAIDKQKTNFHLIEGSEIRAILRQRPMFASKADFGSGVIIAGRYGMVGASVMAARGALRGGIGKLTVFGPQCAFPVVQTAVPEAMFEADANKLVVSDIALGHHFDAIAAGPGLGTDEVTIGALEALIRNAKQPLVLDADALNCIAARPALLNHLPLLSLITPHDGEFDRLFGEQESHEARLLKALEVSRQHNILILLKGHYTALVRPDGKIYFNSTGTPAMATPGSGDVLTGLVTALMAQGYKPEVSAIIAAYIHGRAGEIAEQQHGQYGVTATDIADTIGRAIADTMQSAGLE